MAKETLLIAPQVQSVEPYIQNVLIEKNTTLLQGVATQADRTLTQEILIESKSTLLLPSKNFSTELTQDILISEHLSVPLITTFPMGVDITYVPYIKPTQPIRYPEKPLYAESGLTTPKLFASCDSPPKCVTEFQYQNVTPSHNLPVTTPSTVTILDDTIINTKWHPDGILFSSDVTNNNKIIYTGGKIFIHNWHVLPIAQIIILGKENYHPERQWTILENITGQIIDTVMYYIFIKVPISEDVTIAEIILTKEYAFEKRYDDYLYLLMGEINYIKGFPVFSMLWGNEINKKVSTKAVDVSNVPAYSIIATNVQDAINELAQKMPWKTAYDYDIIGDRNGINMLFTIPNNYYPGTPRVFLNGVRLQKNIGWDYIESSPNKITLNYPVQSIDLLLIDYIKLN